MSKIKRITEKLVEAHKSHIKEDHSPYQEKEHLTYEVDDSCQLSEDEMAEEVQRREEDQKRFDDLMSQSKDASYK